MARYELILKLDGALWLKIISKPLLTKKMPIQIQNDPKIIPEIFSIYQGCLMPCRAQHALLPSHTSSALGWFGTDFNMFLFVFGFL